MSPRVTGTIRPSPEIRAVTAPVAVSRGLEAAGDSATGFAVVDEATIACALSGSKGAPSGPGPGAGALGAAAGTIGLEGAIEFELVKLTT